ncbi:MAG: DUF3047 domain-containing protein [Geminicoccaceae bacterium]
MALLDLGRVCAAVLALIVSLSALAGTDEVLLADGWRDVLFDNKTPNRFEAFDEGGIAVISEQSVSLLQKPLAVDLDNTPVLAWRWRVTEAAPATDLGVKGEDDRSLALYVAFPFQPEEASVFERMRHAFFENMTGEETPGRVLVYIWGGIGARGDRVPSPYLGEAGIMTILRPADTPLGSWFDEAIDIAEDYRTTFGSQPPAPVSLAIGADTDDTRSTARALVTDIAFIPRSQAF